METPAAPPTTPPTELEILAGSQEATAHFRDGTSEPVQVRLLSVRQLAPFASLIEDEADMVEFVCGKPTGWADRLTHASHAELVEQALALNQDPFLGWLSRRANVYEKLGASEQVARLSTLGARARQSQRG